MEDYKKLVFIFSHNMNNSNYNTGPKIFLRRLFESGVDLSDIELLNPSLEEIKKYKKSSKVLIGRLDGTSYYDFSTRNFEKFLISRGYYNLAKLVSKTPNYKSLKFFNFVVNRYLDRTCDWLIKNADGLIFQSETSLEMHQKFFEFSQKIKTTLYYL